MSASQALYAPTYYTTLAPNDALPAVTELTTGQIGHGLRPRATPSYDDSLVT